MPGKTLSSKPRAAKTAPVSPTVAPSRETKPSAPAPVAEKAAGPAADPKPKAVVVAPTPPAAASTSLPTREQIARRAYEIYAGRGMAPGREAEDWAQAERELIAEMHKNN